MSMLKQAKHRLIWKIQLWTNLVWYPCGLGRGHANAPLPIRGRPSSSKSCQWQTKEYLLKYKQVSTEVLQAPSQNCLFSCKKNPVLFLASDAKWHSPLTNILWSYLPSGRPRSSTRISWEMGSWCPDIHSLISLCYYFVLRIRGTQLLLKKQSWLYFTLTLRFRARFLPVP